MSEQISVAGLVATTPRHLITQDGLPITSFRLASSHRRFDRSQNKWVDGETNWFTVTGFRQLAINASTSVSKGDRVLVTGKLRVRDWDNGERAGTSVEVEADGIGHDLSWGSAVFTRTVLVREPELVDDESTTPATVVDNSGEDFQPEAELVGTKKK
jgi:single-strand DNA-binding protein